DGISWSSVGTGINNTVNALSINTNNELYVGGIFTIAGGISVNGIAKWDGINWSAIGISSIISVNALGFDNYDNLFAVEGTSPYRILKWDGTAWSNYITSSSGGSNIAIYGSDLFLGGGFDTVAGLYTNGIAHWNGMRWLAFGNGTNGVIEAIAEAPNGDIYVGGRFTYIGGVQANYIAKWDGINWSALGSGTDLWVFALKFDKTGNLYVGGAFDSAGGVAAKKIAKWDGATWDSVSSGIYGTIYSIAIDTMNNVYVGGDELFIDSLFATQYLAKWDGSNWSSLASGVDEWVNELQIDSQQNLYVGGGFYSAGGVFPCFGVAKWNGSSWSAFGTGISGYLRSMTIDKYDNVYVGGGVDSAGGLPVNGIAKWDGTNWTALGNLYTAGEIWAMDTDTSGNLYASGQNVSATSVTNNNVVKWDGTAWSDIGSLVGSASIGIRTMSLYAKQNCRIYAGGIYENISGILSENIAWYGTGTTPTVSLNLSATDTVCINSAAFTLSGESPTGGIFYGAGVVGNSFDPAIAGDGTHIITYDYNGGSGCSSYAKDVIYVSLCTNIEENKIEKNSLKLFPNPTSSIINIIIDQGNMKDYKVTVLNVLGEIQKVEMNDSILSVSKLSSGIYFIAAYSLDGKQRLTQKFIKE
ncbi:MAG: T9SS type A sorting domain-containing protein, partial [Bacteroidetes bacterium]|nr:T9SS type A sorting domain-containing protein [Bacteroidota bacterium]